MLLAIVVSLILVVLAYYLHRTYDTFNAAGIPYKPAFPIVGSLWKSVFRKLHTYYDIRSVYTDYGDDKTRYVGFYNLTSPTILIKDLELIKHVAIKDFDSFTDRSFFDTEPIEPLFGKNLVALTGQKWRDMRATLSPAFTSSKMKDMHTFVNDCAKQMALYLEEVIKTSKSSDSEQELKEFSSLYMNDVIMSSAFGVQVNSFKDKNNEFLLNGKSFSNRTFLDFMKFAFSSNFPAITKMLGVKIIPIKLDNFYKDIILSNMKYRNDHNVVRPDMIHLLMKAQKGTLKNDESSNGSPLVDAGFAAVEESKIGLGPSKSKLSDMEIVAQAMVFYFAGFDTSSTVTSFALYELAANANIQKKLHEEIDEFLQSKDGDNLTYDKIIQLKYLDMVLSESLRMWPPASFVDRKCIKDQYNLGPVSKDNSTTYTVKKNDSLWIPIYSIHHDSRYWKDPHIFDPERFSDENKGDIKPCTYMPFGIGPRNCIGSRFALMTTKTMLFHLLSKFRLELSKKTLTPLELDMNAFTITVKGGLWIKFIPR